MLRLTGCTDVSTTADHIHPVDTHPHLEYERTNLQGACSHCNRLKWYLNLDEAIAKYGLATHQEPAPALDFFD